MVSPNGRTSRPKPVCLVVDDEPSVRSAFEIILSEEYTLHLAENGRTAQNILSRERVDIVLLDLALPDIHGIEILRQIRRNTPELPVIIVTATSEHEFAKAAADLGVSGYLDKPFDIGELKKKIRTALQLNGLSRHSGLSSLAHAAQALIRERFAEKLTPWKLIIGHRSSSGQACLLTYCLSPSIVLPMARKPRVEFSGAFYHVIARGNQRQALFHHDRDRLYYLDRLEHYRKRYECTLYAYVLMPNHVHLLLETGPTPLSKIMQGLQFTYTRYFNHRYHKVGHLFQGRYTAILCDRDVYLVALVRYLHLNPARMRRPLNPWRYPWSSHRAYVGDPTPVEVETTRVLGQFAHHVGRARQGYLKFIAQGLKEGHQAKYYDTVDQRFLGDERFIERVDRRTGGGREIEVGQRKIAFAALVQAVADVHGLPAKQLVGSARTRAATPARAMLVYLARQWGRVSGREVSRRFQRDPSRISRLYARYAANRDREKETRVGKQLGVKSQ